MKRVKTGRIAIRDHGKYVHFYIAEEGTMDGAHLILMADKHALEICHPEFRDKLIDAMKLLFGRYLREAFGVAGEIVWSDETGPPEEVPN